MTSPEYQAPTWVNEDDPDFVEGVSPDLGAGYLNQLAGAVEDHGQRLGAITPVVTYLNANAISQDAGDNRWILQDNANGFAPAEATANALAGKQPLDADLTAIAGLDSATAGTVASDGAGWVKKTYAQMRTALGLATIATSGKLADATDVTTTGAAVGTDYALRPTAADPFAFELTSVPAAYAPIGAVVLDSVRVENIPEPWTLAHRGLPNMLPENTMESYRAAYLAGAKVFETDVLALSDGALVIIHDSPIDRTTNGTGNVKDHSVATWYTLRSDYGDTLGGAWTGTRQSLPFLSDLLDEFGGKVCLVIEGKATGVLTAVAQLIEDRYPHLKQTVVLAQFLNYGADARAEMAALSAAGWITAGYADTTTLTAADWTATGVTYAGLLGAGLTTAYMDTLRAAGLKVWARPSGESRAVRKTWIDAGAVGHISDDFLYAAGSNKHRRTTDPFDQATWYHGHLPLVSGQRGAFTAGGRFQMNQTNTGSVLQGWASPLVSPSSFKLTMSYQLDTAGSDANQWSAIALMTTDTPFDPFGNNPACDGYHLLIRQNGTIQIYRVTDNVSSLLQANVTGVALPAGSPFTVTIDVTPTTIKLTRGDTSASVTATDSTYRGEYLHFTNVGIGGHVASFADVTIT